MDTKASAAERNVAVVQGQENLTGVKEVRVIKKLKKNSESEFVVSQSTRTEMLYDTADEAKSAYNDIQNAKEDAEFEDKSEDASKITPMEEDENKTTSAAFKVGMVINAKYIVRAQNPINNTTYLTDGVSSGWIPTNMVAIVQNNPNFAFNLKKGQIVPADTGTTQPTSNLPQQPIDMSTQQSNRAINDFVGFSGYASDPTNEKTPEMQMQTGIWAHAEAETAVPSDIKVSDLEDELKTGVNREMEHTNNPGVATEIALDHLTEDKQYYTKLNEVLPEEGVEHKPKRNLSISEEEESGIEDAVNNFDYKSAAEKYMNPEVNND